MWVIRSPGSPVDLTYRVGAASDDASSDSFSFSVSDTGDGDSGALSSNVANVAISIDRAGPGSLALGADGIVRIGGTSGADNITAGASGGYLKVVMNGQTIKRRLHRPGNVSEIRIWAERAMM